MGEMSLVLFTVLTQSVVGGLAFLCYIDRKNIKTNDKNYISAGKRSSFTLLFLHVLALLISLGHLGRPLFSYRALVHFSTSWLSREVVAFSVLLVILVVYAYSWLKNSPSRIRINIGITGVIVGILGIVATGMVYVLPARPAWNNAGPIIFFLLTAFLIGPLLVEIIFAKKGYSQQLNILQNFTIAVIVVSIIAYFMYISILYGAGIEAKLTVINLMTNSWFWLRVILGWLIPLGLLLIFLRKKENYPLTSLMGVLVLVVLGELLARNLFYSTIVMMKVGQF